MRTSYDALVVGGGIGGIRAALDLAETGQKVALIDSRPHLGGLLLQLDRQFPTDNCGMCKMLPLTERESSSQFCLRKGLFHSNIDILRSTELEMLEGDPGSFHAVLRTRSHFVDPARCIGCGACAAVCPVRVPDEFNAQTGERPAVYLPVPHAIPNHYVVDLEHCKRCWQCHDVCPTGAITFHEDERAGFRILVAGDDQEISQTLAAWFKNHPFPVEGPLSGNQLQEAMASRSDIDLVLLDLGMQEPAPESVLGRIKELHPRLPVILVGGPEHDELAQTLLQAEAGRRADGHLHKPFDMAAQKPWLDKVYMRAVSDTVTEVDTAAVILGGGFQCYDPSGSADVLGYGLLPDVVTSLEFERLCSSTGPDKGRLARRSDGRPLRRIAWLQCVGSRDLQKNADFCSSICCMISVKEALMALEKTGQQGEQAEAVIFCMDLRTFGKQYQGYVREAGERGVRFVRSRIHSVIPSTAPEEGSLQVEYVDDLGRLRVEHFDMLVLAVGARPPEGMRRLVEATGVETNPWGFCKTMTFEPARTSRLGVFAAGSFSGPKDIAESLIQADAAALGASRLINIYAPIREKRPEPEPEYRDVTREQPRVLAALCTSCPRLAKDLDVDGIREDLAREARVRDVVCVNRACTQQGWEQIMDAARERNPNRVLIGACMPYAYVPRLHELGAALNLNPALMDVVDVASPLVRAERDKGLEENVGENMDRARSEVVSRLRMGAVKLLGADPSPLPPPQPVTPAALVVGGGLAGITAALGIADHGYHVTLVEEAEQLGGRAMLVRRTMEGEDPVKYMEGLIDQAAKHPNITVHTEARVVLSMGRAGRFLSVVATDEGSHAVEHGAVILATGAQESKIYDWGFRVHKSVLTHQELEQRLADGVLDVGGIDCVAMIQCWRYHEKELGYCSRVCCNQALKNALELKRRKPSMQVVVFYRDMMSYGFNEQYFTEARRQGVHFVRFEMDEHPEMRMEGGKTVVTARDPVLDRTVEVHADLLSVASGIEPNDTAELLELFGVENDEFGFFKEAEIKWRPVDFMKQGVFACGMARGPANMDESILSAKAAAQRAIRVLRERQLVSGSVVAEVRHSLCSLCGRCIEVCPYGARSLSQEMDKVLVDAVVCQGCGACAAVCPNSASILRGFTDIQVHSMIDAALDSALSHTKPGQHQPAAHPAGENTGGEHAGA